MSTVPEPAPRIDTLSPRDVAWVASLVPQLLETGLGHRSWPVRILMAHLRAPASVGLAARSGRQRIGFAVMQVANAAAHLDLLGVLPAFRRRGVASRLLAQLERHALELGAARLTLELRESNAAGRRFYEALGYRECGREAHYYCGRETAVHMQRALATGTDQRWPDGARPI